VTQILKLNYSHVIKNACYASGENLRDLCLALPHLRELEVVKRGVETIKNIEVIVDGLMKCRHLTALTLQHPTGMGDNIANFIKEFSKDLKKLDLGSIGKVVARQIRFCSNLVELHLSGQDIPEKDLNQIVKCCQQLVVVGFSACNVTDTTMQILLSDTFQTTKRSLHTLLLHTCLKPTDKTLSWIKLHTDLRILKLCKCKWVTANSLLEVAKCCKKIHHLDIKHALIQPGDIEDDEEAFNSAKETIRDLVELLPMAVIDTGLETYMKKK